MNPEPQVQEMKKKKAPRDRGTGSIYRQPGTMNWTIQYYLNGKRVREKTGTDDRKAAQQKLTARLSQIDKGEAVLPSRRKPMLVEELYEELEKEYIREGRRSLRALRLRWQHLKPVFGIVATTNVTKDTILTYMDARIAQSAAVATVNRELSALKKMFRRAADKLPRLPVFPKKITERNIRKGFVEGKGYALLTQNASELWLRTFLEIAFSLCWRRSEILGLRVGQVDLDQRRIRLEPESTKNRHAREAPMTEKMHQLLTECIAGKSKSDFVLTRAGKSVHDFRTTWRKLCAAAGMPGLLVHDLRRSGARQLRKAGVAESVIMAIGGWETSSVFKRYDITSDEDKVLAIDALEIKRKLDVEKSAEVSHKVGHKTAFDHENQPNAQKQMVQ